MNRKLLISLCMLFGLFALSFAQDDLADPQMAKESTAMVANMRKVELLNQILPLALQPSQIQQILPVLERVRDKQRKLLIQEHKDLLDFQKQTQAAVDAGLQGKLPSADFIRTIEAFYKANDIRRQVANGENLDTLMPVIQKVLDKGQQKVMANSLTLQFFEPDLSPANATDDQKERVFCREVLLDPLAYDLLVQMGK